MRAAIVVMALATAGGAALGQSPGDRADEDTAIREIVQKYSEARAQEDPAAIAALFTEDADQLTSAGEWRRGREALVRGALASSARTQGTRTITVEAIRFPTSGVALADARYEISGIAGEGTRRMRSTFLLTRTDEGWRIAAIRNMLPATTTR